MPLWRFLPSYSALAGVCGLVLIIPVMVGITTVAGMTTAGTAAAVAATAGTNEPWAGQ
jgi:hypothetical protein